VGLVDNVERCGCLVAQSTRSLEDRANLFDHARRARKREMRHLGRSTWAHLSGPIDVDDEDNDEDDDEDG
jgi:hypothetical protein